MQIFEFKDDPTKKAVIQLVKVMSSDFGDRFRQAFKDEDQVKQLKQRLYSKLKGLHVGDIYDGYELLVEKKPSFVPSVPEVVEAVLAAQKMRIKVEREQQETQRLATLPPPQVVSESAARANLRKIHELLGEAGKKMERPETETEKQARLVRLAEARKNHEELLSKEIPLYGKTIINPEHKCAVGWCDSSGTMTSSTSGSQTWYCSRHFSENQKPRS